MVDAMNRVDNRVLFDGVPATPYSIERGVNFEIGTYYIPIPSGLPLGSSIHLQGDGVAVATATVQHTDFADGLDGLAIPTATAGVLSCWDTDAAVGALTIAASVTETGQDRATYSNQPHLRRVLVLVVTAAGRIRGATSGIL
jgi:hypothetical protein